MRVGQGSLTCPIRPLVHEIQERLNWVHIVSLAMEPELGSEPDTTIDTDVAQRNKFPAHRAERLAMPDSRASDRRATGTQELVDGDGQLQYIL